MKSLMREMDGTERERTPDKKNGNMSASEFNVRDEARSEYTPDSKKQTTAAILSGTQR